MANTFEKIGKAVLTRAARSLVARPKRRVRAPRRIAVVRQDARLGNVIAALPVARACASVWSGSEVFMIVARPYGELVRGAPGVSRVVELDRKGMLSNPVRLWEGWRALRSIRPDIVFDCSYPHSFSLDSFLFSVATGARIRVGFSCGDEDVYDVDVTYADGDEKSYRSDVLVDLVRAVSGGHVDSSVPAVNLTQAELSAADVSLLQHARPRVAVHLAAPNGREWCATGFADVSRRLAANSVDVVALSGPRDETEHTRFTTTLGNARESCLHVRTPDLRQLAAVITVCDVFVSVDCGPLHVAVAVGTPTVTLFRHPQSEQVLPDDPRNVALFSEDASFDPARVVEAVLSIVRRSRN
jgi:ADP-heptose:LPS heptosyltransferase